RILYVAMEDTMLRQLVPSGREGIEFAAHDGIAGVPVQAKMRRGHRGQNSCRFRRRGGIACELILNDKEHSMLAAGRGSLFQLVVDSGAIRLHILYPPEIEA